MAVALDSSYLSGITPFNQGNLSQRERVGLGSLAPQAGYGLQAQPAYSQIIPQYPANPPSIQTEDVERNKHYFPISNGDYGPAPTPNLNSSKMPYYDPFFSNESMIALRNYLSPQIAKGVDQAQQSRGLGYSGVGQYMQRNAQSYLGQIAPNVTPGEAQAMDLSALYGPAIVNGLIKNGELSGATPYEGVAPQDAKIRQQATDPKSPLWQVQSGENVYGSPGYWYDPNKPPAPGSTPWDQQNQDIHGNRIYRPI